MAFNFVCFCLDDTSKIETEKESSYKKSAEESEALISETQNENKENKYDLQDKIETESKSAKDNEENLNDENKTETNVNENNNNDEANESEENKIITQAMILNNNEYRTNGLKLCTLYNGAFLTFISKYCTSQKMIDKLWEQLIDYRDIGYIEKAEEIAEGLAFMAMQYKQRMHQKKNKKKSKKKIAKAELLNETKHISVWIVKRYGKQRKRYNKDLPYFLVITKDKWQNNLPDWLNKYVKSKGIIEEND